VFKSIGLMNSNNTIHSYFLVIVTLSW